MKLIYFSSKKYRGFNKNYTASYLFSSTRFFNDRVENSFKSDVPMYSMSHLHRVPFGKFSGTKHQEEPKSLHDTSKVIKMSHHRNKGCVSREQCRVFNVNVNDGYFLHHRIGWKVTDQCKNGKCVEYDPILLKYRTRLENNMKKVLKDLKIK